MRRISETRLRDAERNAPARWVQITAIRSVVEPNGPGGCDGPPIDCGIIEIKRTRRHADPVRVLFEVPRKDLTGEMLDRMTDDEIAALAVV